MSAVATAADVLAGTRRNALLVGDCLDGLHSLPDGCVQTCVTSPPYLGLRDYGMPGQIGQEGSPRAFADALVAVFAEVRRVLRDDGTLWLNLGDSYANDGKWGGATSGKHAKGMHGATGAGRAKRTTGLKPKDLMGVPWRVAFALQDAGWWLRSDIIWSKPNPMPESVTDRPTRAHEYLFLLTKSERYFYDADAIREPTQSIERPNHDGVRGILPKSQIPGQSAQNGRAGNHPMGRNARTVWTITPEPFDGAHFATMPPELARRCILAGSRRGDVVLDPFAGAGTTALVAVGNGRRAIGCELNPEYARLALDRVAAVDTDAAEPVRVEAPQWGDLFAARAS